MGNNCTRVVDSFRSSAPSPEFDLFNLHFSHPQPGSRDPQERREASVLSAANSRGAQSREQNTLSFALPFKLQFQIPIVLHHSPFSRLVNFSSVGQFSHFSAFEGLNRLTISFIGRRKHKRSIQYDMERSDYLRLVPNSAGARFLIGEELTSLRKTVLGLENIHESREKESSAIDDEELVDLVRSSTLQEGEEQSATEESDVEESDEETLPPIMTDRQNSQNVEPVISSENLILLSKVIHGKKLSKLRRKVPQYHKKERSGSRMDGGAEARDARHYLVESTKSSVALPIISTLSRELVKGSSVQITADSFLAFEEQSTIWVGSQDGQQEQHPVPSLQFLCLRSIIENLDSWLGEARVRRHSSEVVVIKSAMDGIVLGSEEQVRRKSSDVVVIKSSSQGSATREKAASVSEEEEEKEVIFYGSKQLSKKSVESMESVQPGIIRCFEELPIVIYRNIFLMMLQHRLLTKKVAMYFEHCWIEQVDLAHYPRVDDQFLTAVLKLRRICYLDLTNCKEVTDRSFGTIAKNKTIKLQTLILRNCVSLSDASVSKVVLRSARYLKKLDLHGCYKLTDRTLNSIITCSKLRDLDMSKVKLISAPFLCQLSLLTKLQSLKLNCCVGVNDVVVKCWTLSNDVSQILNTASKFFVQQTSRRSVRNVRKSARATVHLSKADQSAMVYRKFEENLEASFELSNLEEQTGRMSKEFARPPIFRQGMAAHHRQLRSMSDRNALLSPQSRDRNLNHRSSDSLDSMKNVFDLDDGSEDSSSSGHGEQWGVAVPRERRKTEAGQWDAANGDGLEQKQTGLSQLKTLELGWTKITNASMNHVLAFTKLQRLEVSGCSLSREGLRYLCTADAKQDVFHSTTVAPVLQHLREFSANYCDNLGSDLLPLGVFSKLEVLQVRHAQKPNALPTTFRFLRELNLGNSKLLDTAITELLEHTLSLEKLVLQDCLISNKTLRVVANLVHLKYLDLSDPEGMVDRKNYSLLTPLVNLETLVLFNANLRTQHVHTLTTSLTSLEHLNLDSSEVHNASLQCIGHLLRLKTLNLFSASLGTTGLRHLLPLKHTLQEVTICSRSLDDASMDVLKQMTCLEVLNVAHNQYITDQGLMAVSKRLFRLRKLNIGHTGVTKRGVLSLVRLERLEELNVRNLSIDGETVAILMINLPKLWHVLN